MQHLNDGFRDRLKPYLAGTSALEIGCGNGTRTQEIAAYFTCLTGIDPDPDLIATANSINRCNNITFQVGSAEKLAFPDNSFGAVLFPLSFHHVPVDRMQRTIAEAARVVTPAGHVIFIEPTHEGSLIEAELLFGCCDGDERKAKALACYHMLAAKQLTEVCEFYGESLFLFDSEQDFFENIAWKEGTQAALCDYLERHNYKLSAKRRINVFRKTQKEI
jgi:ubiquinone/menaquinone biosynthesis C-methylase UbiE